MARKFVIASLLAVGIAIICVANNASAIEIADRGANVYPTEATSFYQKGLSTDNSVRIRGYLTGSDLVFQPTSRLADPWGDWSQIGWDWDNPVPLYSLLSFSMTIQISAPGVEMYGFKFEQTVELANTCEDFFVGSVVYGTFHCDFLLLTRGNVSGLTSYVGSRTAKLSFNQVYANNQFYNIFVHPGSYVTLTNNSLSSDDRAWLKRWLTDEMNSDAQDILDKLDDVIAAMPAISKPDIADAVEDGESAAREDEKDEYEQQAQDNETAINSDSSAAQGAATSLLGVVGQFIGVLTSAQPTNCNLDGSLIPHLNLGNLNLCTYQMPTALTVLGSLVLIAFVVPLAYFTVKRMLALIGSFQS